MDPTGGMLGDILGFGSSMTDTFMDYRAQQEANQMNLQIARETNGFNAEQSKMNRDWQSSMSNSAHQREVADLKAAGLNPILSARNQGASSPGGSAASGIGATMQPASMGGLNRGLNSAMSVMNMAADLKNKNAQAGLTEAARLSEIQRAIDLGASAKGRGATQAKDEAFTNRLRAEQQSVKSGAALQDMENRFRQDSFYIDKAFNYGGQLLNMIPSAKGLDRLNNSRGPGPIGPRFPTQPYGGSNGIRVE